MKNDAKLVKYAAFAGIAACIGEFVSAFIYYPGYDQLKETMSALGASNSPLSFELSSWWIIMGLLLIFFGIGFRQAFSNKGKAVKLASWLIILYAIGEGFGSGFFKADHIGENLTTSAIVHDIVGGIGVFAILLLPFILQNVFTKTEMPGVHRLSIIIFYTGIGCVFLFLFRYLANQDNFFAVYKGLWQRLLMLNTYIYLFVLSLLMLFRNRSDNRV